MTNYISAINAKQIVSSLPTNDNPDSKMRRAWLLSCMGYNAGRRFDVVPMLQCFRTQSGIFRSFLRQRLFLDEPVLAGIPSCTLCAMDQPGHNDTFRQQKGIHLRTQCVKCQKSYVHDRMKSKAFFECYKSVGQFVFVEAAGLYKGSDNKPADVGVPASTHETPRMLALDIGITDPCLPSSLPRSSSTPMYAADTMGAKKLGAHNKAVSELGRAQIDCDVLPIILETSGAFGKHARKWWEEYMVPLAKDRGLVGGKHLSTINEERPAGANGLLAHTWTANTWTTLQLQKFDWGLGVAMTEKVQGLAGQIQAAHQRRLGLDYGF